MSNKLIGWLKSRPRPAYESHRDDADIGTLQRCQTQFVKSGNIDGIDGALRICGWAYNINESPAQLLSIYDGVEYQQSSADQYRADLEMAGIGSGHHAFSIPLPCDPAMFDPARFEVRFTDGSPLTRSEAFASWTDNLDLLSSPVTRVINIEFTSRCNLRCVYCAVSQPEYNGRDMEIDDDDLDRLVQTLKSRKVQSITVNGHGETTLVPGWHKRVNELAAAGFNLNIITNFARLLEDHELSAMARISCINVSVDTHRAEVLRKIRRRVSLGNILINMARTTAKATELGLPRPSFVWSCVITNKTALDLLDLVRFGLACGVRHYILNNLVKYPDVDDGENVDHVVTLSNEELLRFSGLMGEAQELVTDAGGHIEIMPGLADAVADELQTRGIK